MRSSARNVDPFRHGFTLWEMLLVLVVLTLLACLSLPALEPLMSRRPMLEATEQVVSALLQARETALTGQRTVIVEIQSKREIWFRSAADDSRGTLFARLPVGVQLQSADRSSPRLAFSRDGTCGGPALVLSTPTGPSRRIACHPLTGQISQSELAGVP